VVERTGRRAVLVAGWSDLSALQPPPPPRLLIVPSAPHDWLLPRCRAAVHHCGAGTCAAVLRAGVPSVPCPVMLDQPSNALRLVEAGCAVAPLPFAEITAQVRAAAGGRVGCSCCVSAAGGLAEMFDRSNSGWVCCGPKDLISPQPHPHPPTQPCILRRLPTASRLPAPTRHCKPRLRRWQAA